MNKQLRALPILGASPLVICAQVPGSHDFLSSLAQLAAPAYSTAAWLKGDGLLNQAVAGILKPGIEVLTHVGLNPDNQYELAAAGLISLWAWTTGPRLVWSVAGRPLGVWNPAWFEKFLVVPWRPFWKVSLDVQRWWEEQFRMGPRATGGWAGPLERMTLTFKPSRGDIYAGRLQVAGIPLFQPIGFKTDKHFVMVAGAGSGKTTLVMTQLAMHAGNMFVIDPKGQITKALARRRGQGGQGLFGLKKDTRVLDPYGMVKGDATWDALDWIDCAVKREKNRDVAVRYSATIAEGLIKLDKTNNPFFPMSAREFVQGLILYVWLTEKTESGRRNLVRVRELLTKGLPEKAGVGADGKPQNAFAVLLAEMEKIQDFDGVVAKRAASLAGTGPNARGDVLATARQQTGWLDFPEVAAISRDSNFKLEDLKTGNLNLFVCAPAGDIQSKLSGWFRMLTVCALDDFEHIPGRLDRGCFFVLDEFPSLGRIEAIAMAAPVMRSFGVQLLIITQDLERLQMPYPDEWEGFLGNAEAVWWMGTNHESTAAYLEKVCGTRTIKEKTPGRGMKEAQHRWVEVPVIRAEQAKRTLEPRRRNVIITRNGQRPVIVKNGLYFRELPVCFYNLDSDFREKVLRQQTRRFFEWLLPPIPDSAPAAIPKTSNPHGTDQKAA